VVPAGRNELALAHIAVVLLTFLHEHSIPLPPRNARALQYRPQLLYHCDSDSVQDPRNSGAGASGPYLGAITNFYSRAMCINHRWADGSLLNLDELGALDPARAVRCDGRGRVGR